MLRFSSGFSLMSSFDCGVRLDVAAHAAPAASKYRVLVSTVSASAITVVNGAGRAITGQNRMSGFDIGAAAVVIASTDRDIVGGPTAAGIVARASGAVR